jgi:glycerol-1-phosphate dehydrogenase [NAD(P)+]
MSLNDTTVVIGNDEILEQLEADCTAHNRTRFAMVVDANTYLALGVKVEALLHARGWKVRTILLGGAPVIPDEQAIFKVLDLAGGEPYTFLAVGGGTIHDITRFASHRIRCPFISLPTAASMDGFSSDTCSLMINGYKSIFSAQGPLGVYAYLPTLCAAPVEMTAAGFADMLGKFTSLADWKLGHLLWDEPYDEHAAQETWLALQNCLGQVENIAVLNPRGIRYLMEALVQAGFATQRAGSSRPAGGSEHHLAHYWEMMRLRAGLSPLLHGARVGVGTYLSTGYYAVLRRMTLEDAKKYLNKTKPVFFVPQADAIQAVFGPLADRVLEDQEDFMAIDEAAFKKLKKRVLDAWPQIQNIAATVPAPRQIVTWLHEVGAPAEASELELGPEEVDQALKNAHLLRGRFSMLKLAHLFGMA